MSANLDKESVQSLKKESVAIEAKSILENIEQALSQNSNYESTRDIYRCALERGADPKVVLECTKLNGIITAGCYADCYPEGMSPPLMLDLLCRTKYSAQDIFCFTGNHAYKLEQCIKETTTSFEKNILLSFISRIWHQRIHNSPNVEKALIEEIKILLTRIRAKKNKKEILDEMCPEDLRVRYFNALKLEEPKQKELMANIFKDYWSRNLYRIFNPYLLEDLEWCDLVAKRAKVSPDEPLPKSIWCYSDTTLYPEGETYRFEDYYFKYSVYDSAIRKGVDPAEIQKCKEVGILPRHIEGRVLTELLKAKIPAEKIYQIDASNNIRDSRYSSGHWFISNSLTKLDAAKCDKKIIEAAKEKFLEVVTTDKFERLLAPIGFSYHNFLKEREIEFEILANEILGGFFPVIQVLEGTVVQAPEDAAIQVAAMQRDKSATQESADQKDSKEQRKHHKEQQDQDTLQLIKIVKTVPVLKEVNSDYRNIYLSALKFGADPAAVQEFIWAANKCEPKSGYPTRIYSPLVIDLLCRIKLSLGMIQKIYSLTMNDVYKIENILKIATTDVGKTILLSWIMRYELDKILAHPTLKKEVLEEAQRIIAFINQDTISPKDWSKLILSKLLDLYPALQQDIEWHQKTLSRAIKAMPDSLKIIYRGEAMERTSHPRFKEYNLGEKLFILSNEERLERVPHPKVLLQQYESFGIFPEHLSPKLCRELFYVIKPSAKALFQINANRDAASILESIIITFAREMNGPMMQGRTIFLRLLTTELLDAVLAPVDPAHLDMKKHFFEAALSQIVDKLLEFKKKFSSPELIAKEYTTYGIEDPNCVDAWRFDHFLKDIKSALLNDIASLQKKPQSSLSPLPSSAIDKITGETTQSAAHMRSSAIDKITRDVEHSVSVISSQDGVGSARSQGTAITPQFVASRAFATQIEGKLASDTKSLAERNARAVSTPIAGASTPLSAEEEAKRNKQQKKNAKKRQKKKEKQEKQEIQRRDRPDRDGDDYGSIGTARPA